MKAFKDYEILDEENEAENAADEHAFHPKRATTPHFQANPNDQNKTTDSQN
jgi:hypothetical protein